MIDTYFFQVQLDGDKYKRLSATASRPTNAFFTAPQLYSFHLKILFPDSKGPGVSFPLRLVEPAQHTDVSGERGTHTKPRGTVLWESTRGEMHVSG